MDATSTLLTLFGLWLAAPYVLGPFLVRLGLRAPERYVLPEKAWPEFVNGNGPVVAGYHGQLMALGFVPVTATEVPGVGAALYIHPVDGSTVQLRHTKQFVSVCFSQEYHDGSRLMVGNAPLPAIYPDWSRRISYYVPEVGHLSRLFDAFKAIRARQRHGALLAPDAALQLRREEDYLNAEMDNLLEQGIYSRAVNIGKRAITLKGAFYASWRLAWLSKPVLLRLAAQRAARAAGS